MEMLLRLPTAIRPLVAARLLAAAAGRPSICAFHSQYPRAASVAPSSRRRDAQSKPASVRPLDAGQSLAPTTADDQVPTELVLEQWRRLNNAVAASDQCSTIKKSLKSQLQVAVLAADPVSAVRKLAEAVEANRDPSSVTADDMPPIQLKDMDWIARTQPLPTRKQYPNAAPDLFNHSRVASAMNNLCQKWKIQQTSEIAIKTYPYGLDKHTLRRAGAGFGTTSFYRCTLDLTMPDVCQERAVGEAVNKVSAVQAAWLQVLSQLHVNNTLKELLSDGEVEGVEVDDDGTPLQVAKVDQATMVEQKDAKLEIYNYAASRGLVPIFTNDAVAGPRSRRIRSAKKAALVHSVAIKLDELDISVKAAGKTRQTAEVAASLLFKQKVEELHADATRPPSAFAVADFKCMSLETARSFFMFCQRQKRDLRLEMEVEQLEDVANRGTNKAVLQVDGAKVGEPVVMQTKKLAEDAAYLSAAVHIARANPTLLADFNEELEAGQGRIIRPMTPIDLHVDFPTLETMRSGLLAARAAGLPDQRPAISAEVLPPGERENRKRPLAQSERESANDQLLRHQVTLDAKAKQATSAALPMAQYSAEVLDMVKNNTYSIIIGATGSGKTTQVPQILFNDAIRKGDGASCNIMCTQPRRIAATSVARRVADERDEPLRRTVGYHVRFDAQVPYQPYGMTFCTTGILLEQMKHITDDIMGSYSHILIDEVHERDLNIDYLMVVLKGAIAKRRAEGLPYPHVILMSATLDPALFSRYFAEEHADGKVTPCPTLSVPGRTFPVREIYLASTMSTLIERYGDQARRVWEDDPKSVKFLKSETDFSALSAKEPTSSPATSGLVNWKAGSRDEEAAQERDEALVPIGLISATVAHIVNTSSDGAILVFLPGLEEILAVQNLLFSARPLGLDFTNRTKFKICLLHSQVSKEDQAEIFTPLPPGCRRIILATNIAETSITVPDVKFIVDSGKQRELRYDQISRITRLQCVWESKSNSKQRAGRAGRVQAGHYYAMFARERADSLRPVTLPELLRCDLQETCLSVKARGFGGSIASFLSQAIEPPSAQAVDVAVGKLRAMEALTADESLTALGRVLSKLPLHPSLGKMIILGVIFRCLDPMLILGAASAERSLFTNPVGHREAASRAHDTYLGRSESEHLALLDAFKELRHLHQQYGRQAVFQRGMENYLHFSSFFTIDKNARQIETVLMESGLIPRTHPIGQYDSLTYGSDELNVNSSNTSLVRCLMLAGVFPNIAAKQSQRGDTFRTPTEHTCMIRRSSMLARPAGDRGKQAKYDAGALFTYSTMSRSTDGNTLAMSELTRITPLMALLFGGRISMAETGRLVMDDWLPFFIKWNDRRYASKLLLEYRKALDRMLYTAFDAMNAGTAAHGGGRLALDPMIQGLTTSVAQVLDASSKQAAEAGIDPFLGMGAGEKQFAEWMKDSASAPSQQQRPRPRQAQGYTSLI